MLHAKSSENETDIAICWHLTFNKEIILTLKWHNDVFRYIQLFQSKHTWQLLIWVYKFVICHVLNTIDNIGACTKCFWVSITAEKWYACRFCIEYISESVRRNFTICGTKSHRSSSGLLEGPEHYSCHCLTIMSTTKELNILPVSVTRKSQLSDI